MTIKKNLVMLTITITITISVFVMSCSNEAGHNKSEFLSEVIDPSVTLVKDVEADEFKKLFEDRKGTLIDVRTPGEVANGFIEGSINIDFNGGDFEDAISKLDKQAPVYVYCGAGGRSGKAMNMMKDMGFSEVYNLIDGYGNWPFK